MTSEQDPPEPTEAPAPRRLSRRQLGGAVAIGAAVVWTSEFPFADAAIGQTLEPADGPTGPTGPTGTAAPTGATGPTSTTTPATTATTVPGGPSGNAGASGASGAGGENLATTGMDPTTLGAVGAAAALAGGALVWLRRRGGDTPA